MNTLVESVAKKQAATTLFLCAASESAGHILRADFPTEVYSIVLITEISFARLSQRG